MEIYRDSMNSKSDLTLSNISLMEIIRNTRGDYDLIKNANYIPQIEEIDGTVFVNTECKSYINDNRGDYIKYLILDEDMQLTHDSDSPGYVFARLHTYLVRLVLPRALPEPEGIYIDYIINVNNISLNSIVDNNGAIINTNFDSIDSLEILQKLDDKLKLNFDTKKDLYNKYFADRVTRDSASKRRW